MSEKAQTKTYDHMENVLQYVMKKKISLSDEQVKNNNPILTAAIDNIITKVKELSPLFKTLFQQIFFGGSYYDGLKTGCPAEYDLDLLLKLPKKIKLTPIPDIDGFVSLQLVETNDIKGIETLLEGTYFSTNKMLQWMEGLFAKAIKKFPGSGDQHIIEINNQTFYMKICKSGPAFTLKLYETVESKGRYFDVDLVPCFIGIPELWPQHNFRENPIKDKDKSDFIIVPKIPKVIESMYLDKSWRLSFQKQERVLINGHKALKPCIKLIKILRDKFEQKSISSYFIKTIFLWEVTKRDEKFWDNSLSFVYMEVYANHLVKNTIPYFWNNKNNLLDSLEAITLSNYGNRVNRMIVQINKTEDPFFVSTYYLSSDEVDAMKQEVVISKKSKKYLERATVSLVTENNSAINANIGNLNINTASNGDYELIIRKLDMLHKDIQKINDDVTEIKHDNAALRCSMNKISDKLEIVDGKFLQLAQQNRLLLLKLNVKNECNLSCSE